MSVQLNPATAGSAPSSEEFRRALGHYPTGVAVITAREADGTPVGLVVGTFTSVSLEPPLVGFLVDRASSTWPRIRATGHFCVNVLSHRQEQVCRAFVTKDERRFDAAVGDMASGSPRLDGTALWVDCDLHSVVAAGDHDIVLGAVRELGVAADRPLPLVFLRGGYGQPRLTSLQAEEPGLGRHLRLADRVRGEVESLAHDLGLECLVSAAADGHVVILAAAGIDSAPGGSTTYVGAAFPLAAPFAAHLVAWADPEDRQRWLASGNRLADTDVTAAATAALASVREIGYMITTGRAGAERFRQTVFGDALGEPVVDEQADVIWRDMADSAVRASGTALEQLPEVTSLHAPIHDGAGRVALSLDVIGMTGQESAERRRECRDRLLLGAQRASSLLVGRPFEAGPTHLRSTNEGAR